MDRSRVGIVIPALNESGTISSTVRAALIYGVPIVVDDGSDDETPALALAAGAILISHGQNLGYDAALNSGFRRAAVMGFDILVTLDADGQHDPTLVRLFLAELEGGADVVVGTRTQTQRLAERLFAWYTRRRYGINDPLCGIKAYRMEVYRALGHFDSYRSIGTELMLFAAKKRFNIAQVPFRVRERQGPSRFGRALEGNLRILRSLLLSFVVAE